MRRFLLGVLTAVLTLVFIVGAGMLLAGKEKKTQSVPAETLPSATEQTVPVTTEATLPPETTVPVVVEEVEEKVVYDRVPLYYQTDYPHINFGSGTVATSGCSVTCLAMVATYLTDTEYTPPQMACHFLLPDKNFVECLDYGIAQMQLPCQRSENIHEVVEALENGKVVILMMGETSFFTTEQHFIVVAGVNEAGKFVVNDPLETNYIRADTHMKDGYDNGFSFHHLSKGFSGAWIFDKADMGPDPFLYEASLPEELDHRYEGYTLTQEDIDLIARFVYAEARNEPQEARQAVAEVVLNRLVSEKYPDTIHKVIYQTEFHRAVSSMKHAAEPAEEQYEVVEAAMYGPYVLPKEVCFYSAWAKGENVWGQLGSLTFAERSKY